MMAFVYQAVVQLCHQNVATKSNIVNTKCLQREFFVVGDLKAIFRPFPAPNISTAFLHYTLQHDN